MPENSSPAPSPQSPAPKLFVASSPHLRQDATSRRIMLEVAIALLPVSAMAVYNFRLDALALLITCSAACIATEYIFNAARRLPQTAFDGSALVTGMILALSLPPTLPLWIALVGSVVAIAIGKMVFGGLGFNIFNPAMAGRAFLMASFGTLMTTWVAPVPDRPQTPPVDAVSQATPLMEYKAAVKTAATDPTEGQRLLREAQADTPEILLGTIPGSLGETSVPLILIGGIFLLVRRTISWRIPSAMLAAAALIALITWLVNPDKYLDPIYHLSAGSLLFGAFFIATDPVSCPLTHYGRLLFGAGVGAIVMLIRLWGGYPEGVMYAVLFMNALTPLLDRWTKPTPLGGHTPQPQ